MATALNPNAPPFIPSTPFGGYLFSPLLPSPLVFPSLLPYLATTFPQHYTPGVDQVGVYSEHPWSYPSEHEASPAYIPTVYNKRTLEPLRPCAGENSYGWIPKGYCKRRFEHHIGRWVPRLRCLRKKASGETVSAGDYEFKEEDAALVLEDGSARNVEGRTTVTIKNIPNQYTKEMLLALLDNHCLEQNRKLREVVLSRRNDQQQPVLFSEFDFFYLPIDFGTGSNLGYAFVNFTSAMAAWRFHRTLHKWKWLYLGSRKVCEITYARLQGLEALERNFRGTTFSCNSDDLLPCVFFPPRNGSSICQQRLIGRRILRYRRPHRYRLR